MRSATFVAALLCAPVSVGCGSDPERSEETDAGGMDAGSDGGTEVDAPPGCSVARCNAGDTVVADRCVDGGCDCSAAPGTGPCPDGYACCPGDVGCLAVDTDIRNCGDCGVSCNGSRSETRPAASHCAGGSCACGSGPACTGPHMACCGGPSSTESCVDTQSSASHCGACGNACNLANATERCEGGRCAIDTCVGHYGDCNGIHSDGCETDLSTLVDCGSCGTPCSRNNARPTCDTGVCRIDRCDVGWGDCDGRDPNGCETPLDTLADCGSCGAVCDLDHATESCDSGTCRIDMCESGWADADGRDVNGCETAI